MSSFYNDTTAQLLNIQLTNAGSVRAVITGDQEAQLNRIEEKLDQLLAAQKKKYVQLRTVNK